MAIVPAYRLDGRACQTVAMDIVAASNITLHGVVEVTTAGAVREKTATTGVGLGVAAEKATAGVTGGPESSRILIFPFDLNTVYRATPTSGTVAESHKFDPAELAGSAGAWTVTKDGATANTIKFQIIDVDTVRNEYLVVLNTSELDQIQFYQAAQV